MLSQAGPAGHLKFSGVISETHAGYDVSDAGTGRCRLTLGSFERLGIRLGWILLIEVLNDQRQQFLCTAWSDTLKCLEDDMLCMDTSVTSIYGPLDGRLSDQFLCSVLAVYPAEPSSTCYIRHLTIEESARKSSMIGLAVSKGFYVSTDSMQIQYDDAKLNNGEFTVIGPNTLIIKSQHKRNQSIEGKALSSYTVLVDFMTKKIAFPSNTLLLNRHAFEYVSFKASNSSIHSKVLSYRPGCCRRDSFYWVRPVSVKPFQ